MKKPRSLDVVLSLRQRDEETAERALAEAAARVQVAKNTLQTLQQELSHTLAAGVGEPGRLLHAMELHAREHRVAALRHAQQRANHALAESEQARTHQQAAYLEVRRGREAVGTLVDQRDATEQLQRNRRETKRSEDLFLGRLSRRQMEEHAERLEMGHAPTGAHEAYPDGR